MPQITIDDDTHQRLSLVARVAKLDISEVVRILANDRPIENSADVLDMDSNWVPIYSNYLHSKITGDFNPKTRAVRITSGDLIGTEYSAPSAAAIAVVRDLNPKRENPHTNGLKFWKDTQTRRTIRSQYPKHSW